jgi:hypothetical protein
LVSVSTKRMDDSQKQRQRSHPLIAKVVSGSFIKKQK